MNPDAEDTISSSTRLIDVTIGWIGMILPVAAGISMAFGLPWQIRFTTVLLTAIFGPAIPGLRVMDAIPPAACLVVGAAVDVALVMFVGQVLVMTHLWVTTPAMIVLFSTTFLAGARLVNITTREAPR
jgi:hypothetical protein